MRYAPEQIIVATGEAARPSCRVVFPASVCWVLAAVGASNGVFAVFYYGRKGFKAFVTMTNSLPSGLCAFPGAVGRQGAGRKEGSLSSLL